MPHALRHEIVSDEAPILCSPPADARSSLMGVFCSVTENHDQEAEGCGFATIAVWGSTLAQAERNGASCGGRLRTVFRRTTIWSATMEAR